MTIKNLIKEAPEKYIERQVLSYLNALPNCLAFKNGHNGRALDKDRWIRTKGTLNGVADITCIYKRKKDLQNFVIFFEVKTSKGKQSEYQKLFEYNVKRLAGHYYVVRSIDEAKAVLDNLEANV